MTTAILHARIFDGERVLPESSVVIEGDTIRSVGGAVPAGANVIDARGATLLPGLIDAHVHTSVEGLRAALRFGVTTELEMGGGFTRRGRQHLAGQDDLADVRSPGLGITPPGGHPDELLLKLPEDLRPPAGDDDPDLQTPEDAATLVDSLIEEGADYIKVMIEEGTVLGSPGLPLLGQDVLEAVVRRAHAHGKLAVAHVLTLEATQQAIDAGIDVLAHVFLDRAHTPEIVAHIARSGAFMTPCICLNRSIFGHSGADLAADPRVRSRLGPAWIATLEGTFNTYPQGRLEDVLATVRALHEAGVDLLVGTDVSVPMPALGGLAHGASVHHELQLFVQAGLTPREALRAATALPARRFGLHDRGRVAPGKRADLLLVGGDPTTTISDTLNIRAVWRGGVRQPDAVAQAG